MTERFSPEYIAFILSDEASVLQQQWKKRGVRKGDWAWDAGTETGKVRLVTSIDTHTHSGSLDFVLDGVAKRWTAEVDWLPTLTDLLGMIEEADWEWSRNPEAWHAWKPTPVRGTAEKWASIKDTEDILAAATLAVRVLEGKE